jgi:hypothetical protein
MDTILLVVTVVSLVVAAASATVAWQVTRADRQRRAARVAALAAAAGVGQAPVGTAEAGPTPWSSPAANVPPALHDFTPTLEEWLAAPAARMDPAPVRTGSAAPAPAQPDGRPLFTDGAVRSEASSRQHWLMRAAGAVAAVVVGIGIFGFIGSRSTASEPAPARTPLELVALSHNRVQGSLAVTGLIRNPGTGSPVETLEAEVRVFDPAGIVIATKTAPVEVSHLAPGQESPFVVGLGEVATAARYRVSFRASGTMLPHVDRRVNAPAAVTAEAR